MASRLDVLMLPQFDRSGGRVIVTAGYGDGRGHRGVDLGSTDGIEAGTDVLLPVDGAVVAYTYDGPFRPPNGHTAGHNIWIMGTKGQRFKAFHLQGRPTVPLNVTFPAGTPVAKVGNSGTQAAHLHWEEHAGGWMNPINCEAEVRECLHSGRFAGTVPPTGNIPDPKPPTTPPMSEEDDPMILCWQENTQELYLVSGGVKIYIPATSKGGVSGDEMKAAAIAMGAEDRTKSPGAAFLEIFPTVRP